MFSIFAKTIIGHDMLIVLPIKAVLFVFSSVMVSFCLFVCKAVNLKRVTRSAKSQQINPRFLIFNMIQYMYGFYESLACIRITRPCNPDPLKLHFYIGKLGLQGYIYIYTLFSYFCSKTYTLLYRVYSLEPLE